VQRAKLETLRQQIIKTDIRSPHAGIVLKLDAREGEVIIGASSVSSGTVLMRIADLSRLKVDTRLNEVDVVKVNVGDKVQLTFDAVPNRTIAGTVTYISPSADTGESSSQNGGGGQRGNSGGGGSVRGFETIVALDEVDSRIRPGITAHVKISMSKVSKAVAAPLTAVFIDGKRSVAYVKRGEQFEKREIEPGISDSAVVEIKKGLAAGDEIATEKPADDKLAPTTAPSTAPTTSTTVGLVSSPGTTEMTNAQDSPPV
jgi:HlyD family secretion protein